MFVNHDQILFEKTFNLGLNILKPYSGLVQIQFTTSKTKRDI